MEYLTSASILTSHQVRNKLYCVQEVSLLLVHWLRDSLLSPHFWTAPSHRLAATAQSSSKLRVSRLWRVLSPLEMLQLTAKYLRSWPSIASWITRT